MAANLDIKWFMEGNQCYAEYTDGTGCFQHSVKMQAKQPFTLCVVQLTGGPYKGEQAIIFKQTPYFPFERLLPELRQAVYRYVFANDDPVFIGAPTVAKDKLDRSRQLLKWSSLLQVNRTISFEAKQVLWQSQHFIVDSMTAGLAFFKGAQHAGRKYITRLTVRKTVPRQSADFYKMLEISTQMRFLTLAFPSKRLSLGEHIDKYYECLMSYVAPKGADRKGALRRLDTVYFDIGPSQRSVLDSNGEPYKTMTPELNDWCRRRIRNRLLKQFPE